MTISCQRLYIFAHEPNLFFYQHLKRGYLFAVQSHRQGKNWQAECRQTKIRNRKCKNLVNNQGSKNMEQSSKKQEGGRQTGSMQEPAEQIRRRQEARTIEDRKESVDRK
jgi:hypothetical protein